MLITLSNVLRDMFVTLIVSTCLAQVTKKTEHAWYYFFFILIMLVLGIKLL